MTSFKITRQYVQSLMLIIFVGPLIAFFLCVIESLNAHVELPRADKRNGTGEVTAVLGHRRFQPEQWLCSL